MKSVSFLLLLILAISQRSLANPPYGFADLSVVNPNIKIEMRYFSEWNFMGRIISGYQTGKCILTNEAAKALSEVQNRLQTSGYSLLVFDCYRPKRSVAEFLKWVKDPKDQKMQKIFYPDEPKEKLVEQGYIAELSSHSRGSAVDLTIVQNSKIPKEVESSPSRLKFQEAPMDCRMQKNIGSTGQLNMGTTFDCFSKTANYADSNVSKAAKKNRLVLKDAMEKSGFMNYSKEWWHFTLKDEPYKGKYYDFIVQ